MAEDSLSTPLPHSDTNTGFISSYLDLDGVSSDKMKTKMEDVYEFLRGDKKEYDEIDGLTDLRHLMFKLGTPPLGTSKLDYLHSYVKIQKQIDFLEKERDNYVR